MNNAVSFANVFLSYLLAFIVFGICIVAAVMIGIKVRKSKNKKEELADAVSNLDSAYVEKAD